MTSYERLKKALEQNKDSFETDDDGIICVKECAIAAAVKRFKDEYDGS
ncbi:hypothetical protein PF627_gp06 [Salmonella virus VSiP]|uniref:Uncharacterized protein n=1 Tax=Salmonella virus VSiP TaxID=2301721 RepID=A0A385EE87_9CAUD|nr:hypothetical protein PF627_gp06 [Salmonella virus VSiP]AXQ70191.1 hypothetical protein vsip_06 [Salmonella virus VSiP]